MKGVLGFGSIGIILTTANCSSAPKAYDIERDRAFSGTYDAVWEATIDALTDVEVPLMNFEKDSGLITSDWMSFGRTGGGFADCGSAGLLMAMTDIRGRFTVFVQRETQQIRVRVNPTYSATMCQELGGGGCHQRSCVSTGGLENSLYNRIALRGGNATAPSRPQANETTTETGWRTVRLYTGSRSTTTEPFEVTTQDWRVTWYVSNADPGAHLFVTVVDGSGREVTKGAVQRGPGTGQLHISAEPGTYFVEITALDVDWQVTVDEKRVAAP